MTDNNSIICKLAEGTVCPCGGTVLFLLKALSRPEEIRIISDNIKLTGRSIDIWLLISGVHLDFVPLIITLLAWPFSQFFTPHCSSIWHIKLSIRIFWENMWKALLKSR